MHRRHVVAYLVRVETLGDQLLKFSLVLLVLSPFFRGPFLVAAADKRCRRIRVAFKLENALDPVSVGTAKQNRDENARQPSVRDFDIFVQTGECVNLSVLLPVNKVEQIPVF